MNLDFSNGLLASETQFGWDPPNGYSVSETRFPRENPWSAKESFGVGNAFSAPANLPGYTRLLNPWSTKGPFREQNTVSVLKTLPGYTRLLFLSKQRNTVWLKSTKWPFSEGNAVWLKSTKWPCSELNTVSAWETPSNVLWHIFFEIFEWSI